MLDNKKITIKDIARDCGVSTATVSLVLNQKTGGKISGKTISKVTSYVAKTKYTPSLSARNLQKSSTDIPITDKTIILNCQDKVLRNDFYYKILESFWTILRKEKYRLLLNPVSEESPTEEIISFLTSPQGQNSQGWLFLSEIPEEVISFARLSNIPSIFIGNAVREYQGINKVSADNIEATQTAVNYIYNHGFKKITLVTRPRGGGIFSYEERYNTFVNETNHLKMEAQVFEIEKSCNRDELRKIYDQLLADRDNALLVINSELAVNIYLYAVNNKKTIPNDISIMAFDELPYYVADWVNITTLDNAYQIGRVAATKILSEFKSKVKTSSDIKVNVTISEKNSVRQI